MLGKPWRSLKKCESKSCGSTEYQTVPCKEWPILASKSAQQLPSLKMCEEITWIPWLQALCHQFLSNIETSDLFLKTDKALVESLSNQMFLQPLLAANSIARMKPYISTKKTKDVPILEAKVPRKAPKWSRNKPPQAPKDPTTEPSVLTFNQGVEGAFQLTNIISLIRRLWCETEKASRIVTSEATH